MFNIRSGCDADKPQIIDLIEHVFGVVEAKRAERRWHWQWHEDPRLAEPGYRGIVAEWNGRIIGNVSSIPAGLYMEGKPVCAIWFTDALVHWGLLRGALRERKRKGQGDALDLSNGIAAAMMNSPAASHIQMGKHISGAMETICYRIDFTALGHSGSWARLISFRQPAENLLGKNFGCLLGGLANLAIAKIPTATLKAETMTGEFDSRFDELWVDAKAGYQAITLRDRATLNWRYRKHPDTEYTVLTVERNHRLEGYLVYSVFYRHQQRRAQIVDILVRPGCGETFDALIANALTRMRGEHVHKVECYAGDSTLIDALQRAGFAPRLDKGKAQSAIARRLPVDTVYITRGDGDGG